MKPLTLQEFAEQLRVSGDYREAEFADEILTLIDLEIDVAEPYWELVGDVEHLAPDGMKDKPRKVVEWLGDRSNMLAEIEEALAERISEPRDADDEVKLLIGILGEAEDILEAADWSSGDFIEALHGLAERAARAPEEMEILTYDL